ncbi:hypothetical protein F5I97DRAFT_265912 [Phlebopus sp. FC_14]|nr:hypothetical protein F5I97DRAFT_265912 [Phlebopus sp. FC_14]
MSLDVFQQVFSLSLASNAINDQTGTQANLQAALTVLLDLVVPAVGDWKVVWGPVVWKNDPDDTETGPDNSWYIAYNPSLTFDDGSVHPTYVVAVAGTANNSMYAWVGQNFAVNSVADFNQWVAGGISKPPVPVDSKDVTTDGTYVAIGAVKAAHNLLTFPAPPSTASAGTSLLEFLRSKEGVSKARVVFTGHSLGGALSPTLALALVSSGTLHAAQGTGAGVLAYPSAGASPGNRGLADLFAATLPARRSPGSEVGGYQVWNLNLVNILDIVPQAWCIHPSESPDQNLDNIPPIYGKPVVLLVVGAVFLAKVQAFRSGTIYIPIQSHLVTGTRPEAPPTTIEEFLKEAMPQHVEFYIKLLGITLPTVNESFWREYGLVEKTESQKLLEFPIIANVEWAAEHPEEVQTAIDAEKAREPAVAAALAIKE